MVSLFWLLLIPASWLLARLVIRLRTLDRLLQKQRRRHRTMLPGDASQLPQIDQSQLPALTRELEALGFVVLGDLIAENQDHPAPSAPSPPLPDPHQTHSEPARDLVHTEVHGLARIFGHPVHGCYASLMSVIAVSHFAPGVQHDPIVKVMPFRTGIMSLSGTDDNSWTYTTHDREEENSRLRPLLRHPRKLRHRIVEATAGQLLEVHLTERDAVAARVGCRWDKELSFTKYQEHSTTILRHIQTVYERATPLGAAWVLMKCRLFKNDRWLNELTKR